MRAYKLPRIVEGAGCRPGIDVAGIAWADLLARLLARRLRVRVGCGAGIARAEIVADDCGRACNGARWDVSVRRSAQR